ncbi:hypothetical protein [Nocardia terpenica]|uniref:Uncharacterized protein n=1 Tax=Nocardia terpenica TaxID=455432 RepID=A0A164N6U6_9NOCA|nr:hypothetical protein [Nocardia terpenica]KZM74044.1 hypothetical protein AWN90_31705 [Nocardia terpenica]NQE91753.1 hypothetical protein [Nocardia terpenica]
MPAKSGVYIGATATELRGSDPLDKAAGVISQKALFHRRGDITLTDSVLTLSAWADGGDLTLRPSDITSLSRTYTELYGRFIGGLLNSGKPLILQTIAAGTLYLLIDRSELLETTKNGEWARAITAWLDAH